MFIDIMTKKHMEQLVKSLKVMCFCRKSRKNIDKRLKKL